MEIISKFNEESIQNAVFGENGATLKYADGAVYVTDRKEKYDSLAVRVHALLGGQEAYKSTFTLKTVKGTTGFCVTHKIKIEYLGLEYTMYELGKNTPVTDSDWSTIEAKVDIPAGSTVIELVAYFIQQGKCDVLPDIIVKECTVTPAEAQSTVTVERKASRISRQKKTTFGVIRWDAYMETGTPASFVSDQVARSLSPKKYHHMAPFFARVTDENKIEFPPATQAQFDKEAELALKAGIDYFAYCWYDDDNPMSYARKQHLVSPFKDKIRMCAIIGVAKLAEASVKSLALCMKEDCYLRFDGRPVVYAYDAFRLDYSRIKSLQDAAREAGINEDLYFIGIAGQATPFIINTMLGKGMDAIGAYGCAAKTANEPYAVLAERTEGYNDGKYAFSDKLDVVPLIIFNRDTSPRIETPVSWAGDYSGRFAQQATGEELYLHASRVLEKMRLNPEKNIPNTVISYAWNEHDEGGWCCPSLAVDGDGKPLYDENGVALMNSTYLNAIARALKDHREKE